MNAFGHQPQAPAPGFANICSYSKYKHIRKYFLDLSDASYKEIKRIKTITFRREFPGSLKRNLS